MSGIRVISWLVMRRQPDSTGREGMGQGVFHVGRRSDLANIDAKFDDGLGDGGRDAGDDALASHERRGPGHFDQMIGHCGVHHPHTADVEDEVPRLGRGNRGRA